MLPNVVLIGGYAFVLRMLGALIMVAHWYNSELLYNLVRLFEVVFIVALAIFIYCTYQFDIKLYKDLLRPKKIAGLSKLLIAFVLVAVIFKLMHWKMGQALFITAIVLAATYIAICTSYLAAQLKKQNKN